MITSIGVVRRFNLNALLRDRPEFDGNRKKLAEALDIKYPTLCGFLNPTNAVSVSDSRARSIESQLKLEPNWMDQDRVPTNFTESDIPRGREVKDPDKKPKAKTPVNKSTRLTTARVKREKKPVEIIESKTGTLTFEADGFLLKIELRRGDEDTAEVTRAALRIVEIRSR